jgi:hypothetical protein
MSGLLSLWAGAGGRTLLVANEILDCLARRAAERQHDAAVTALTADQRTLEQPAVVGKSLDGRVLRRAHVTQIGTSSRAGM